MTRADWAVVLLAISILPVLYGKLWFSQGIGQQASIWVNGRVAEVVPLDNPRELHVQGVLGISTLEVRNHQIRFLASPCRGKICIHGGWLKDTGAMLACLPNRITVRILGSDTRFDAVNF